MVKIKMDGEKDANARGGKKYIKIITQSLLESFALLPFSTSSSQHSTR